MENENIINKNLKDYVRFYLSLDNPQFALLINGKWGSGKTYFIKNEIATWNNDFKTNKDETSKKKFFGLIKSEKKIKKVTLKPIYISLYGISSTLDIDNKIKEELNPLLYSKGAKIIKNAVLGAVKTATHINFDSNNDGKSDGKISFDINSLGLLKGNNLRIKGNKVLVFDDLERCSLKISDLFGYINEFVEHYNCKILLLSDEDKIYNKCEDNKESYKEFKEKLIGKTFTIQADVENAINSFINKSSGKQEDAYLLSATDLIKDVFIASRIENLRILRQSILDFERFVQHFEKSITDHPKYKQFLNSLLGHYILVYLEYKSGNKQISKLTNFSLSDKEKGDEKHIRVKYDETLNKYEVRHRNSVIEYQYIIDFINNGFTNPLRLNNSLKANIFFRGSEVMDWEKLWSWEELEDSEFKEIFKNVKNEYLNHKIEDPNVLLHIITIFFSLLNKQVIEEDKDELIKSFEIQFDKILQNNKNKAFLLFSEHSFGKGYREINSVEYKQLHEYANDKIVEHNSQNKDDYLKNVFENLNNENISELQEKLNEPLPDKSSSYSFVPVLPTVDGNKLAESLLRLSNKNLDLFFSFMNRRYCPEKIYSNGYLEPFNAQDKDCLVAVKERFQSELNSFQKIKKHNIKNHIIFLESLIAKLNKLGAEINNEMSIE